MGSRAHRAFFSNLVMVTIPTAVFAAPPVYDHVVIVVEENKNFTQVIGNVAAAPYINNVLVAEGMNFTKFYGVTHPSQPNYLQMFSGSNQGVTDDLVPAGMSSGITFTTPNLGNALLSAGKTFAGYSQGLPNPTNPGLIDDDPVSAGYKRKHNPWVNWQDSATNGIPKALNRDFATAFPTTASGFAALPQVSFVVPNQINDMHDGTVAQGDTWLSNNINAYYQWAKTHNSLLVMTFDEDASSAGNNNRIPTVFAGAHVPHGTNSNTYTLHNLLRTVEDMHGTYHSGSAANVRSIVGAFDSDPTATTRSFQEGVNGYTGTQDTYIDSAATGTSHGSDTGTLVADGSPLSQALVRFDNIIGSGASKIPAGATILSAKLSLQTGSNTSDESASTMSLHRMLGSWSESDTWSTLGSGVSVNNVEASSTADFALLANVNNATAIFDVTSSIQAYANGAANNGWVVNPSGTDGWRWISSEFSDASLHPYLEVTFVVPEPSTLSLGAVGTAILLSRRNKRRSAE